MVAASYIEYIWWLLLKGDGDQDIVMRSLGIERILLIKAVSGGV